MDLKEVFDVIRKEEQQKCLGMLLAADAGKLVKTIHGPSGSAEVGWIFLELKKIFDKA